jgi:hypothetical protein
VATWLEDEGFEATTVVRDLPGYNGVIGSFTFLSQDQRRARV